MDSNRLTFKRIEPSQLPDGVFLSWMQRSSYGGLDAALAAAAREEALSDPDAYWDPTHGVFFTGSDSNTYVGWLNFDFETQFTVLVHGDWCDIPARAWMRVARAYVRATTRDER